VLFLDELPEFYRDVLEGLRQPLESGTVTIVRAGARVTFPCRFQLIAAMNPCPCGQRFDPRGGCRCTPRQIAMYVGRISGPLLDRIDLHVEMAHVSFQEMSLLRPAEDSRTVRVRVTAAWERQQARFANSERVSFNAQMSLAEIRQHCRLSDGPLGLLRMAMSRLALSPRGYHRVLKVARTIADLAGQEEMGEEHVAEAIAYRVLDRGKGG